MEPHGRAGKSRKPTKLRSISRSLMLCNARASDDGSSSDERYPDPYEAPLGRGKEGAFHSPVQLADTSEAGPGSVPDLALASEAAGSDRDKRCKTMFFVKVRPGPAGPEGSMVGFARSELKPLSPFVLSPGKHRVLILNKGQGEVEAGLHG